MNGKLWGDDIINSLICIFISTGQEIYTTIKAEDVCVYVCVSCLCRPPSHWWISFIFYTIIGLDPEGGQWLFKFKSNHNKKFNRQNAKQYMWDCSINLWSRKHTNSDTVVGFENEMVSAVPVTTQDTDIPRWTVYKWLMVDRAMVRDFTECEILYQCMHRSKPLAICFVQHLEYQRNRIRLIRISYPGSRTLDE